MCLVRGCSMQSFMLPSYYEWERELGSRQKEQYRESIARVVGENVSGLVEHTVTMNRMPSINSVQGPTLVKRKRK